MIVRDADGIELPDPEKAAPVDLWRVLRIFPGIADDMEQEPHSFAVAGPLLIAQYERLSDLSQWVTTCVHALHDRLADDLHNGRGPWTPED
ncbi:hypothetical protein ACFWP2_38500 [Kitasatospora sp. NPDC058444]|uniref:hypothetical protein n=1 Tax=Kitasatospora sp. NPDC058444 TaxID=3346504 RepID=UPI003663094D